MIVKCLSQISKNSNASLIELPRPTVALEELPTRLWERPLRALIVLLAYLRSLASEVERAEQNPAIEARTSVVAKEERFRNYFN